MKYYFVKYTDNIPEKFAGEACGPLIKIRTRYVANQGLLEHEKVHVQQWYVGLIITIFAVVLVALICTPLFMVLIGVSPFSHSLLYKYVRVYRQWCEVCAYRKQISVGDYESNCFAVIALVENYQLGISPQLATKLLVS